jgi:hypothetical protein
MTLIGGAQQCAAADGYATAELGFSASSEEP